MPSDSRRRKKKPDYSDEESGREDQLQPRASHHHSRRSQRPTASITIEVQGDVHIKRDFNLGPPPARKEHPRSLPSPSPTPTRTPSRRLQTKQSRSAPQYESPSASEGESSSYSEDTSRASQYAAPKRLAKATNPPEQPRLHSDRKKRYQPDEGYHTNTSGAASYVAEGYKQQGKGKERSVSSSTGESSRHAQLSSSAGSRKSRGAGSETDPTSYHSEPEEDGQELDDGVDEDIEEEDDEDGSDDDFGKLPIQISNVDARGNQTMSEKAVLDTGTKSDWISQRFYDELKKSLDVKRTELSPQERKEYRNFNGGTFQPAFKVDLMIQSEEFKGLLCRRLSFLVAKKAGFKILMGRETIRKEELMTRGKQETDGEGALIGIHGKVPESEKAETKKKKDDQLKCAQERKKIREAKIEDMVRQKGNTNASSSKVAAHLATSVSRKTKAPSPPKESARKSSSSMDDCTW